jgi:hypothetical protein
MVGPKHISGLKREELTGTSWLLHPDEGGIQMRRFALTIFCFALATGLAWGQQNTQSPPSKMTNAEVIEMAKAGLSEQIITTSIRQARARDFDLTPTALIALKKAGVPDPVVVVMQEVNASLKSVSAGGDKIPMDDSETSSNDPNASLRQELVLIERQLAKASMTGDKATLDKLLPDDFMQFEGTKSYSKAWLLENTKPRKDIKTFDIENAKLRLEGETAALTGMQVIGIPNGSIIRYRFIDRFVKRDGQWLMVSVRLTKQEAALAPTEKPPADNGCSGIENLGLYKNDLMDPAIGGGVVEWVVKIRNNTGITRIVNFGWRDMYGEQKSAQVQIRGGDIARPRLDLTQARVIPPVTDVRVLSCQ